MIWVGVLLGIFVALVPISYLVEALRRAPETPRHLVWAPDIPVRYVSVNGVALRCIAVGEGRPIVLLHTLRTQLDMFQHVIPELAKHFRVYAVDYPGHGYSDIPSAEYSPEFFVITIAQLLDELGVENAVIVGESIGGSIALLLAARQHPRVHAVVAINPYDYDAGRGLRRSSVLANVLFGLNNVPILGATISRLRSYPLAKRVLEGGVYRKAAIAPLTREIYAVGNRRGHYRAFMSLVRHWPEWERARSQYAQIARPVLLLYGEHDWSRAAERDANRRAIPNVRSLPDTANTGHFLSLDSPSVLVQAVLELTGSIAASPGGPTSGGEGRTPT